MEKASGKIDELIRYVDSYQNTTAVDLPPGVNQKNPFLREMIDTVTTLTRRGRGILAMDEFPFALEKRFKDLGIVNSEENRRRYRQVLITSNDIEKYINGVIFYDATLFQKTEDGTPFVDILKKKGILAGIKVDEFLRPMPYIPDGLYTQGETNLDERCKKYYGKGARFSKWRAVYKIEENNGYRVSQAIIDENAITLAKYAAICQLNGLVPIVEPELLFDGNYPLSVCKYWTEKIICRLYKALSDFDVILEATLLKPNMCLYGKEYKENKLKGGNYNAIASEEAIATLETLLRTVPPAVPGIMFLSGGQTMEDATIRLDLINKLLIDRPNNAPWVVSFSFARALQQQCLVTWKGMNENVKAAQNEFIKRCQANSQAQMAKYKQNQDASQSVSG